MFAFLSESDLNRVAFEKKVPWVCAQKLGIASTSTIMHNLFAAPARIPGKAGLNAARIYLSVVPQCGACGLLKQPG